MKGIIILLACVCLIVDCYPLAESVGLSHGSTGPSQGAVAASAPSVHHVSHGAVAQPGAAHHASHSSALWDLTPLFQLYGGQKTNFLIRTVLGEIITVLPCIWLVRTASSLRLAETNSADPFFFSAVLAQI